MSEERFQWLEFESGAKAEAPAEKGKDHRYFLAEARKSFLEGDYEPALRHYSEALKHDKGQHEAWAGQVRCLVYLGELNEAKTWAEKACNLFSDSPALHSARARALAACGFLGEAMGSSDGALEAAEKTGLADPHLWLDRGACLLANQQLSTAEHCFNKALELVPNDPDWQQRVALEWLEGSQPARALALLLKVAEQRPSRPLVWLLQARAQRRLGQRKAASESLSRADSLRPQWAALSEEQRLMRRSCWIATRVYGHERAPAVQTLRRWRERAWLTHPLGRLGSQLYDRSAPGVCALMGLCPPLVGLAHTFLGPLVAYIHRVEEEDHGQKARA